MTDLKPCPFCSCEVRFNYKKDQDKNVYHADDIREIITLLLTLKTDVEHITQRINAILSIGWPGNEDQ